MDSDDLRGFADDLNATLGRRLAVDDDTLGKGLHDIARALDRVADAIIHASGRDIPVEPFDPIYGGSKRR